MTDPPPGAPGAPGAPGMPGAPGPLGHPAQDPPRELPSPGWQERPSPRQEAEQAEQARPQAAPDAQPPTPFQPPAPAEPPSPFQPPPPSAMYPPAPAWASAPTPPRHTARNVLFIVCAAVLAAVVVVVALTVVGHRTSNSTTSTSATSAMPSPGVAFTDPQSRWSATFSGTPKYHETTESTPDGPIPYMYAEYSGFDVDQIVGVLLLPTGSSFDLAKGLEGVASSGGGTVTSSTPGTFQTFASLEGVVTLPTGVLKCEVVKVGPVIYIFGTVGPVNPPTDYAKFVASVSLTPH